jgi:hypothetical protein
MKNKKGHLCFFLIFLLQELLVSAQVKEWLEVLRIFGIGSTG